MKKTKYYSRKFINKESGLAAIEVKFNANDNDCSIAISDCYRRIELEFFWNTNGLKSETHINSRLNKLNMLVTEFTKVRDLLAAQCQKES